jgi:hypothetical protein
MKSCLCCGVRANAEAQTCANCGEGSWSDSRIVVLKPKDESPKEKPIVIGPRDREDASPTVPENFSPPMAIVDPDTAVEVPARRRRNR